MRICKKCESDDFEHVYASVWRCKICGRLDGKLSDLEELKREEPVKSKPKQKRVKDYRPIIIRCRKCKAEIITIIYPIESEFKKLQGAWKKHRCSIPDENIYV